jgi:hypothetical protein
MINQKVLLATLEQKQALEGVYKKGAVLRFTQDENNNWVVNTRVLIDPNFLSVREKLKALPLIDYFPKVINY